MGRQYPCLLLLSGSGPERLQCPPATDLSAELAATLTAKSGYNDSGAAELAAALIGKRNAKLICTRVTGAAGVAINCCSYARGTRVLQNDQVAQKRVIAKIENTRGPVDDEWEKWVRQQIPPFIQKGATRLPLGFRRFPQTRCRQPPPRLVNSLKAFTKRWKPPARTILSHPERI